MSQRLSPGTTTCVRAAGVTAVGGRGGGAGSGSGAGAGAGGVGSGRFRCTHERLVDHGCGCVVVVSCAWAPDGVSTIEVSDTTPAQAARQRWREPGDARPNGLAGPVPGRGTDEQADAVPGHECDGGDAGGGDGQGITVMQEIGVQEIGERERHGVTLEIM